MGYSDKIAVVGLPDTAVKESKDRVTSAVSSKRWLLPRVSLA
jgi:predicted ATPase with chaperone activity